MDKEKRRWLRIPVDVILKIHPLGEGADENDYFDVHLINVSSGGIAFASDRLFLENTFFDLILHVKNCDKIEAVIEIVRASKQDDYIEYGCRFVGLTPENKFRLDVFSMFYQNENPESNNI